MLVPDALDFQQIDDFLFDEVPALQLFRLGLAHVDGTAENPGFQMDVAAETDVVQHRHPAEQLDLLEGPRNPERRPLVGPEFVDLLSLKVDASLLGLVQAVDAVHHHGLAGPVGTDDRVDLALLHLQADAGQGGHLAEVHVDVFELQQGFASLYCSHFAHPDGLPNSSARYNAGCGERGWSGTSLARLSSASSTYLSARILSTRLSAETPGQKRVVRTWGTRLRRHWFRKYSSVIPAMKSRTMPAGGVWLRYSADMPSRYSR